MVYHDCTEGVVVDIIEINEVMINHIHKYMSNSSNSNQSSSSSSSSSSNHSIDKKKTPAFGFEPLSLCLLAIRQPPESRQSRKRSVAIRISKVTHAVVLSLCEL
jgi:hypothetical protein